MDHGEQQIGEMDHSERAIYTLVHNLKKQAHVTMTEREYASTPEEKDSMEKDAHKAMAEADMLMKYLWIHIHTRLGNWNKSIGIREGFNIVEMSDANGGIRISTHVLGIPGGLGEILDMIMSRDLPEDLEDMFDDPDGSGHRSILNLLGRGRGRFRP